MGIYGLKGKERGEMYSKVAGRVAIHVTIVFDTVVSTAVDDAWTPP
jgi:hypothetical protein